MLAEKQWPKGAAGSRSSTESTRVVAGARVVFPPWPLSGEEGWPRVRFEQGTNGRKCVRWPSVHNPMAIDVQQGFSPGIREWTGGSNFCCRLEPLRLLPPYLLPPPVPLLSCGGRCTGPVAPSPARQSPRSGALCSVALEKKTAATIAAATFAHTNQNFIFRFPRKLGRD